MTIPSNSTTDRRPCLWDESFVAERHCTIHKFGPMHVHMATCPVCMRPLTADLQPAFCTHTFSEPGWRCMFDPELERDVK